MGQLGTLMYKNLLLLRRATRETILVVSFCVLLPLMSTLIVNTNAYKKLDSTNAQMTYDVSKITPSQIPPQWSSMFSRFSFGDSDKIMEFIRTQVPTMYLYAAPNTSDVIQIVNRAARTLNRTGFLTYPVYFDDPVVMAAELIRQYKAQRSGAGPMRLRRPNGTYIMGLEFANITGPDFVYYMRPNGDRVPLTDRLFVSGDVAECYESPPLSRCPVSYERDTHLVRVQYAVDDALLWKGGAKTSLLGDIEFWQFGIPPTVFMASLFPVMNLVMPVTFALIPLFRYMTGKLVEEKECSMKQLLVVMGMKAHTFFVSWFIVFFAVLLLVSTVMTLIFYVGKVITLSVGAFFVVTVAHSLCIFAMTFVFSTMFKKTRSANVFATFASLITSMLYFVIPFTRQEGYPFQYGISAGIIYVLMIFPPFTYSLAVDLIFFAEIFRDGLHGEALLNLGQIPIVWLFAVQVFSFVAYTAVGFVLERALSPEYGDTWSCLPFSKSKLAAIEKDNDVKHEPEDFETPDPAWRLVIRISDVWKAFKQSRRNVLMAVKGINLDIYDGQITCILGHNGAGKSTLIGMMTHLLRPTAGKITYTDSNVCQRGNIGICLQSSTHYKSLSVREHLEILSRLKNIDNRKEAINQVIREVGLQESADKACDKLSGGQKRRLNVAIALIGDPKVIFLDEPTSGVDPLSRRAIWQILQSRKAKHCIILTTHYMDEADILSDRKAIVSRGTLRCLGSSLFLKNRFGAGYHLNVEMRGDLGEPQITDAKKNVLRFVNTLVPDVVVREETHTLLSLTLPFKHVQAFPNMFRSLEESASDSNVAETCTVAQSLGVRTYGIELTTLEEVFLRLASETTADNLHRSSISASCHDEPYFSNPAAANTTASQTAVAVNSAENGKLQDLRDLLANSVRPSAFRKWLVLLRLRIHVLLNAYLSTIGVIIFGPVLIFALVCMFSYVVDQLVNIGCNTKRLEFSPLLYAAPSTGKSSLPPLVFDNRTDNLFNETFFAKKMSQLAVQSVTINNLTYSYNLGVSLPARRRLWYSDVALHSPPVMMNTLSNFFMRVVNASQSIRTILAPIGVSLPPRGASDNSSDNLARSLPLSVDQFVQMMPVGLTIIYIVCAVRLHSEYSCGAFNQLRCTGINGLMYWTSHLIVDSLQYAMSASLMVAAVVLASYLFGADVKYDGKIIGLEVIAIGLYMPVSLLFLYVIVFVLRDCSSALLGFVVTVIYFVLPGVTNGIMQIQLINDDAKNAFLLPYYIFLCFPNFHLYAAFAAMKYPMAVSPLTVYTFWDYFKPENQLLWAYVASVAQIIILSTLLLVLHKQFAEKHSPLFGKFRAKPSKRDYQTFDVHSGRDTDVIAEEQSLQALLLQDDNPSIGEQKNIPALMVRDLRLTYKSLECEKCRVQKATKTAVNGLTVSAVNSQIFGLLGPNGAGKTSTLKVVAGSERADEGAVYVGGVPIANMKLDDLFDKVSVCTQDDSLWQMLSVRDHLDYYARLRGFCDPTRKQLVDTLIDLLEIRVHANKRCEQLSGGTKRKVVFAIAMIKTSRVRLILCDEPTSGLDPQSKRVLWNLLTAVFRNDPNCACVFTSHSMEEVEAVCDRIGILIKGELHCLGTIQHCKDKFGSLYTIELKLKKPEGIDHLLPLLQSKFPNAEKVESYVNTSVRINVPRNDVPSLGVAFQILEEARNNPACQVEEYSFGQCTLEQVFLDLVKKHDADSLD